MKVVAILAATLGLIYYVSQGPPPATVEDLPRARAASAAEGVRHARTNFAEMSASEATFADLARPDVYTVFVVSSTRCPPCRVLEKRLPSFLQARPDIVVMTVDVTTGVRTPHPDAARVASTPHVEIYGPERSVVARDDGRDKDGYRLLLEWIEAEV